MDSAPEQQQSQAPSRWFNTTLVVCTIVAIIWLLAARILGPSDAWDQTLPRTMA